METKTLNSQLLQFQKRITVIKKDAINPHFKKSYASLPQIISEVKPILNDCDLVLTQPINENGVSTVISFGNESVSSFIQLPTGLNPQQLGSAITYFRRYTLASILSLEIDDDDANLATPTKLPTLTNAQFEAMCKAIQEGKKAEVIEAMKRYEIPVTLMTFLNEALGKN